MCKFKKILVLFFTFLIYVESMSAQDYINMKLKTGDVVIKLRPDLAPNHVKRISQLVKDGFYDGLNFHRVIPDFMAQGGDPLGNGTGGSGQNIDAEFSIEKHIRGTVSMARAQDPNSADSQFFICFTDAPWLDGQYTIWGQVVEGMEYVDLIKKGNGANGEVTDPDKIISMRLLKDSKIKYINPSKKNKLDEIAQIPGFTKKIITYIDNEYKEYEDFIELGKLSANELRENIPTISKSMAKAMLKKLNS